MNIFMQMVGVMGAGLLLLAYFNTATKRWNPGSLPAHVTNLFGAVFICVNTYHFSVYGPLILNIFWALIALNGLKQLVMQPDPLSKTGH